MAKSEQPANPEKQPRLSDRQWEVLSRVAKGESVAPEKGKRIDLTLNSLVNRGLIETVGTPAPGKPTLYRATAPGLKWLGIQSKTAEPKAPEAEKKKAAIAAGAHPAPVIEPSVRGFQEEKPEKEEVEESETQVTRYVPRKGDIVWNLDGDGDRKKPYYRVVNVGVLDAKLETWSGASWKPVHERQQFDSLVPLSEAELAKAIKDGVHLG